MKKKLINDINKLLHLPLSLYEVFHCKTKIKHLTKIDNDPKLWPEEWKTIYYKGYPRFKEIKLPKPVLPNNLTLKQLFIKRKSERKFSKKPLTKSEISTLLYFSSGVRADFSRFYPSAGARYPLEVYLISLNINQIPKGIYHYYVKSHSLEEILNIKDFNPEKYFGQSWTNNASCFIIFTAVFKRTTLKYGDRGYRYVLIEAGHLGQNIYLNCAALNLSCCAIGGFIDDKFDKLLDLDGLDESIVYAFAIGKK